MRHLLFGALIALCSILRVSAKDVYVLSEDVAPPLSELKSDDRALVCRLWINLALAGLPNSFQHFEIIGSLSDACLSPWVSNYTQGSVQQAPYTPGNLPAPKAPKTRDYSTLCLDMLNTVGEIVADVLWQ